MITSTEPRDLGIALLAHGDPARQRRWLPAIAGGTEIWHQKFSEPEAGSDLANVATMARRDTRGQWIVNCRKVRTSRATCADWGICLARTAADVRKHRGMTMLPSTCPCRESRSGRCGR